MKVFAVTNFIRLTSGEWSPTQMEITIAAPSRAAAARAIGISPSTLAKYGSKVGPTWAGYAAAMAHPGVPVCRRVGDWDAPFRPIGDWKVREKEARR